MAIRVPPQGVSFGGFTVGPAGAVAPGSDAIAVPAISMPSPRPAPGKKKKKNKNQQQKNQQEQQQNQQQQNQQQQTTVTTSSSSAPTSDGKTAAERREEQRQRQAERRAAREEARRNRFNPLLTPFKTPAQLREEAIRLAELGAPSEASLREQQAREEAGLTGLTTATSGALQNVVGQTQAGLRAFGDLYGRLGAQATGAAQSAIAAAGGPTSVAPTVSPGVAMDLAGLSLPLAGMPAAALAIGQRLRGESQANLAKALTQRAGQISSDTAKYLQQLRGVEYEKAVAQETARQNAARLGLSAEEAQRDYEIAQANLGLRQQTVAQGWYNAETSRMRAMRTGNKNTDAKNAKKDILGNLDKWTAADSGIGEFEISAQGQVPGEIIGPVKVQATDAASAEARVKELYPDTFGATTSRFNITYAGPAATAGRAPDAVWKARIRNYMMTVGGMTRAQANAFIKNQVMPSLGL